MEWEKDKRQEQREDGGEKVEEGGGWRMESNGADVGSFYCPRLWARTLCDN